VPSSQRRHEHELDRAILSQNDLCDLGLRTLAEIREALVRRFHQ
jgi:hypothetical protein